MTDNQNVPVVAPEKWMNGWDNIYKSMLELSDDEIIDFDAPYLATQLMRAMAIAGITDTSEINVLDLACGAGDGVCYLAKKGCKVEGVEALANAVEICKRRIKLLGLSEQADVRLADIDGWDIESEKYEVIMIIQSLQYLFDRTIPRLRQILEAIKPGGFFVYSGNILPHFDTDPPIRFITEDEIRGELDDWTFHHLGTAEALIKPGDVRGYIQVIARKPNE